MTFSNVERDAQGAPLYRDPRRTYRKGGQMRLEEDSVDIARDVHDVFAFVSNVANDVLWHTTVVAGRLVSEGPIGLGSRFEGTYDSHRRTLGTPPDPSNFQSLTATIVEFVPDRALRTHVEFTLAMATGR